MAAERMSAMARRRIANGSIAGIHLGSVNAPPERAARLARAPSHATEASSTCQTRTAALTGSFAGRVMSEPADVPRVLLDLATADEFAARSLLPIEGITPVRPR